MIKLGLQTLQFLNDRERPYADQIDEFIPVARAADALGLSWLSASEHWMSAPTVWGSQIPLLSRLAPEVPHMELMTQMLLLPLHNPVHVAEQLATLDQISRGRLLFGAAIGYREAEIDAAGFTRTDRVSRLRESLTVIEQLWTGERVSSHGRWWNIDGEMGFTPYRKPHPPILLAAQSEAATRRAARIADGVFFGPHATFDDLSQLVGTYRDTLVDEGRQPGIIGAGRAVFVGASRDEAIQLARESVQKSVSMYGGWDMQEDGMINLLSGDDSREWAVAGTPADCVETLHRLYDDYGLNHVTLTIYNLPADPEGRLEYVQRLAEDVAEPARRLTGA
ncbi:MAG TPA: LLM class flavin-dependent oxidoreductase [Dehalococcoidia bacterium]|nr:LLM class flavin-dependent oxidoreductase [Dehalococcoidia bacterium]